MTQSQPSRTRRHLPRRRPPRQRGFVLPMVIFLIVILAGAAVAISQLTVDTSAAQDQALQKTRAQWFAQSGLEKATQQLVAAGEDATQDDCSLTNPETHEDFPGLELDLECAEQSYNGLTLWTLTATSQSTGSTPENAEYVWQRLRAVVELEN